MKKNSLLFFLLVILLTACGQNVKVNQTETNLNFSQSQIANYFNYKYSLDEVNKVKKSETYDLYYYAADGRRYVFQNEDVYHSWFGDYNIKDLEMQTKETLYKTPLGGIVTLRPGSLLQTPTDPNIYLVVKNGQIRPFADKDLISKLYSNHEPVNIIILPNWFFSQYTVADPINSISDFPVLPLQITIDEDKGLYKL